MSNSKQNPTGERIIGSERTPGVNTEKKALMSVNDLAAMLDCSSRHIWRMSDSGRMPRPLKLGGLRRWHRDAIQDWLEAGCPSQKQTGSAK